MFSVISISALITIIIIVLFYFYINYLNNKNPVIGTDNFGKEAQSKILQKEIIRQKIRHKEISYFTYLGALIISFMLGAFAIGKIIFTGMDWTLLYDAFSISGGIAATISFKKLYQRCVIDINSLT